jgi:hypothetical protein
MNNPTKYLSQLRRLVASFSTRKPGIPPRTLHVATVAGGKTQGQILIQINHFPCQYHSTAAIHSLMYDLGDGH